MAMDKEREALMRVCQGMIDIVERVGCKDWRDQHGRRLKDTKEWVEFYVTVHRAAEQTALTAQQEPVARFLDRDNDGHWYVVREDKRMEWDAWLQIPADDESSWSVPDFAEAIGGAPNRVIFYTAPPTAKKAVTSQGEGNA